MGPSVKLTVTHDDFDPGSKVLAAVRNGWPMILASLKSLLETGSPLPVTSPEAGEDRAGAGDRRWPRVTPR